MNTDCIIFSGYRQRGGRGYGERTVSGKKWLAHRYAYFAKHGPIPDGLLVCHRCNNKGCINVDHLYLATNQQNTQDAVRDGLFNPGNSKKIKCTICGGPYSFNKRGYRICRQCRRVHNRKHKAIARAVARAAQPSPTSTSNGGRG